MKRTRALAVIAIVIAAGLYLLSRSGVEVGGPTLIAIGILLMVFASLTAHKYFS